MSDVPEIYVSLIGSDSLPQLHESSIINHHPPLPSGDICCDGYTETEPPQSPLSVTSISTNEDTRYNMLSRSLPSSTDNLNSNNGVVIPRPKPSEVDESGRPSSWSEGATVHITVNVSPTKSSPEAVHHETSCTHNKGSYKSLTNSTSKLSDVSQSPGAERASIETEFNSDILMMRPLSEKASDDNEMPPLSEVINKPKAAESKIHKGINVHFISVHCDIYHNHNMSTCTHSLFRSLSLTPTLTHTYIHTRGLKTCFQMEDIGQQIWLTREEVKV